MLPNMMKPNRIYWIAECIKHSHVLKMSYKLLSSPEIPGSTFFDSESDSESMISFTSIPVPIPSLK